MTCDLSDDAQLGRPGVTSDLSDLALLGHTGAQRPAVAPGQAGDAADLSDVALLGHRPGDQVAVLNSTGSGRFIVEGEAVVLRVQSADARLYLVQFADGCVCERFVDPAAQLDPHAYVAALNHQRAAWARA